MDATTDDLPQTNLDYHYYTLGRILFDLAERGLSKVHYDQSSAMDVMSFRRGDEQEVLRVFADVLSFIVSEGIIRVDSVQEYDDGYSYNGVQLTSKGLALIQTKPQLATLSGSIVENAAEEKQKGADQSFFSKWGEFAGSFVGSITKSLGSG
jgi:hypothetical protein